MFTRVHLYTSTGACVLRRLLQRVYQLTLIQQRLFYFESAKKYLKEHLGESKTFALWTCQVFLTLKYFDLKTKVINMIKLFVDKSFYEHTML